MMTKRVTGLASLLLALALLAGCAGKGTTAAGAGAGAEAQSAGPAPQAGASYSAACAQALGIAHELSELVRQQAADSDAALQQADPAGYQASPAWLGQITLAPLQSALVALTAGLGEGDQAALEQSITAAMEGAGYTDVTYTRNDAGSYSLTYTGRFEKDGEEQTAPYELTALYDGETGAIQLVEYADDDGERLLTTFYEFVPLGGGRYAFQTETERALVTYEDGALVSFSYSQGDYQPKNPFNQPQANGVYPDGADVGEGWVLGRGGYLMTLELADGLLTVKVADRVIGGPRGAVIGGPEGTQVLADNDLAAPEAQSVSEAEPPADDSASDPADEGGESAPAESQAA